MINKKMNELNLIHSSEQTNIKVIRKGYPNNVVDFCWESSAVRLRKRNKYIQ